MPSQDIQPGEPEPTDKEFIDIIRSDVEINKDFIKNEGIPAKIYYYCQDCKQIVKPKRIGKRFKFTCPDCKKNNVSFGTAKSLASYYKIPESEIQ